MVCKPDRTKNSKWWSTQDKHDKQLHTTFPSSPLSSFIHVSFLFGFRVYYMTNQNTNYYFFFFETKLKPSKEWFHNEWNVIFWIQSTVEVKLEYYNPRAIKQRLQQYMLSIYPV